MTLWEQKIASLQSVDELEGYEAEARRRGLYPGEVKALYRKRLELANG